MVGLLESGKEVGLCFDEVEEGVEGGGGKGLLEPRCAW